MILHLNIRHVTMRMKMINIWKVKNLNNDDINGYKWVREFSDN